MEPVAIEIDSDHIAPAQVETSSSSVGSGNAAPPTTQHRSRGVCMGCKKAEIEYETGSCRHPVFCKKCAMKCASGGKCKVCGSMYADLRRV